MKPSASHDDVLQAEIARLCDACLFDGEDLNSVEQLQSLLLSNPQAIDAYWTWMMDAANLRMLATASATGPTSELALTTLPVVGSAPRPSVFHRILGHIPGGEFTVGVLVIFVVTAAFWGLARQIMWPRLGEANIARSEIRKPERAAVATIRSTRNAQWSGHREASLPPAIRQGEELQINSGLVELELTQGAKLLIEGPAEWSIDGQNNATLKRGKLVAKVPQQAIGFTLETPVSRVVDLGTEFAVEVALAESLAVSVSVTRGEVRLESRRTQRTEAESFAPVTLKAGEARRVMLNPGTGSTEIETIPQNSVAFRQVPLPSITSGTKLAASEIMIEDSGPLSTAVASEPHFVAAGDDLLQTSLSAVRPVRPAAETKGRFSSQRVDRLFNGRLYDPLALPRNDTVDSYSMNDGEAVEFFFDTGKAETGYDLQRIETFTGAIGQRARQKYRVYVRFAGKTTFEQEPLVTVGAFATQATFEERKVAVFGRNGRPLATGVSAIAFQFLNSDGADPESVYREIDVIGVPTP